MNILGDPSKDLKRKPISFSMNPDLHDRLVDVSAKLSNTAKSVGGKKISVSQVVSFLVEKFIVFVEKDKGTMSIIVEVPIDACKDSASFKMWIQDNSDLLLEKSRQ